MQDHHFVFVDCQTSGANPEQGQIIELAWGASPDAVKSTLVALEDVDELPRRISRLTGITTEELSTAPELANVLEQLNADLRPETVLVAHFARFEKTFLSAALAVDQLPWTLLCTHAVAKRMLPDLPSKGLKALAGYFGHPIKEVKRAQDHVLATMAVWDGLQEHFAAQKLTSPEQVQDWVTQTKIPKREKMAYQIAREVRLGLPQRPGVYRFKNKAGQILYIGKATNLKQRVNSYFRGKKAIGPRHSEFLTQAVELDVTETKTEVEAALLETDEIKRNNPPYNVALREAARQIVYFDRRLGSFADKPSSEFCYGPFTSPHVFDWLGAVKFLLDGGDAMDLDLWEEEDAVALKDGATMFRDLVGWQTGDSLRKLLASGLIWLRERIIEKSQLEDGSIEDCDEEDGTEDLAAEEDVAAEETADDLPLTPEDFVMQFRGICRHGARAFLHAKSINSLQNCDVIWSTAGDADVGPWRKLVFRGGSMKEAKNMRKIPASGPWRQAAQNAAFDIITYDRLRTLRTEINRLEGQQVLKSIQSPAKINWLHI